MNPSSETTPDANADDKPKREKYARPLRRHVRAKDAEPALLVAYDFETENIAAGTPRPLYLTAYARDLIHYAEPVRDMAHLGQMIVSNFLTDELIGAKFVAWNGNNFDAYFIAAAMVRDSRYVMRPYLTRTHALRGLRIMRAEHANEKNAPAWEFLDGMAMLGLVTVSLAKFLANFAPDHKKMTGAIDFERETFDCDNPTHRAYAMQDSIGLWHGMTTAQRILIERFNQPLAVTMGGACIKIFKAHIPERVTVNTPKPELLSILREYVMRGGFCYCVRRYSGPVWKYDLNQAYAAAMRETLLPAGFATQTKGGINRYARIYIVRISATNPRNKVPFYHRAMVDGRLRALFSVHEIRDTWVTSSEHEQLKSEGWKIDIAESYFWDSHFDMRDYVDKLERGRMAAEGGPSGPIGTVYKNVGNHSYGKTVEQLDPIEYALAPQAPPGYVPFYGDGFDPIEHVYYRQIPDSEVNPKDYHQPQIGAFITAYVRMVVRRAALIDPGAWLYADTDCVVFSRDVTAQLDIDAKRYGAWKVEESGTEYKIIAKKVYAELAGEDSAPGDLKRSAKGLNVRKLTPADFDAWFDGQPPTQQQVQRQNFLKVMQGAEMYRAQTRRGTAVETTQSPQRA